MEGFIVGGFIGVFLVLFVLFAWIVKLSDVIQKLKSQINSIQKELGVGSSMFNISRLQRIENNIENLPHNKAKRAQELINQAEELLKYIKEK